MACLYPFITASTTPPPPPPPLPLHSQPDVLLLDEPTNHLDIDAIRWLEGRLLRQECTLMLVTHDRSFLQASLAGPLFPICQTPFLPYVRNLIPQKEENDIISPSGSLALPTRHAPIFPIYISGIFCLQVRATRERERELPTRFVHQRALSSLGRDHSNIFELRESSKTTLP